MTGEERAAYLANALQYEDTGVDFLIEAMNDEEFIVRATAYKLLHSSNSTKAQQAINNGILLKREIKFTVFTSQRLVTMMNSIILNIASIHLTQKLKNTVKFMEKKSFIYFTASFSRKC